MLVLSLLTIFPFLRNVLLAQKLATTINIVAVSPANSTNLSNLIYIYKKTSLFKLWHEHFHLNNENTLEQLSSALLAVLISASLSSAESSL